MDTCLSSTPQIPRDGAVEDEFTFWEEAPEEPDIQVLTIGVGHSGVHLARRVAARTSYKTVVTVAAIPAQLATPHHRFRIDELAAIAASGNPWVAAREAGADTGSLVELMRDADIVVAAATENDPSVEWLGPVMALARRFCDCTLTVVGARGWREVGGHASRASREAGATTLLVPLWDSGADDVPREALEGASLLQDFMLDDGVICWEFLDLKEAVSSNRIAATSSAFAAGPDRAVQVADGLCAALATGPVRVEDAAGAILRIQGGPDMRLAELDILVERLSARLPDACALVSSASIDEAMHGLQARLLLTRPW